MDSFIFIGDYDTQIQETNLDQITGNKDDVLNSAQLAAVEECRSYLIQKYDVSEAFNPISQHEASEEYLAGKTVYLTATAYSETGTYAVGDLTLASGKVYRCNTAIATGESFTETKWDFIADANTVYFAKYPKTRFNYQNTYNVGDEVFWKDKTYTCKIPTQLIGHDVKLQLGKAGVPSIINVFPDDANNGTKHWGTGADYSVSADTNIENEDFWTQGDNRDQKLLQICIDIVIYHLHCRVSPQNVPASRIIRYMGHGEDRETRGQRILYPTYSALGWLQAAAIGNDITPTLPKIQPTSGKRIRYGGNAKLSNSY